MTETPRTPGSRRQAPARRSVPWVLLLPVLAAVLVAGAAVAPSDDPAQAGPREVPVARSTYACAGAPDVATGQVEAGDEATARAVPGGDEVAGVADPRAWVRSTLADAGDDADALVVSQRGEASGAVGFVSGRLPGADGRGLVVGRCSGVVDDAWFTGLGSGQRHESRLLLTNLAATPAVVELRLWSPDGPVDGVERGGIVVDPGTSTTVELADVAAGEPELAVQVLRRRGAVAVTALDASTGASRGSELLDPVPAPAREVLVGGLPSGDRGRTLHVLNPSDTTARVGVEAIGEDGSFVPEGLDDVSVGAGRVGSFELPRSVGDGPVALRLTSATGIVAGVSVSPRGDDVAHVEGLDAWTGAAVVPTGGGLGTPRLVLTAPDGARTVTLEARDDDLQVVGTAEVDVAAGTTVEVTPGDELDLDGASSLVVRSEGGVVGAAQYTRGDRIASLALLAAPVEVLAPQVRPAP